MRFCAIIDKWLRTCWPKNAAEQGEKVSVVFVNYNTLDLTAYLLFTLFRVVGRERIARIVAVDNNSNDGSEQILELFAAEGLIDFIRNRAQKYHGPGINQAISYLAKTPQSTRYIWILDSDIVILKPSVIDDAVHFLQQEQAAAIGQYQFDALPDGYAHISSLLIDPAKCWQRNIAPFDNTGAPAANFQTSLRAHGMKVSDFPYRSQHYILHLARGTLKSIFQQQDKQNIYYDWASDHAVHHYHGDHDGPELHKKFMEVFEREVGEVNPATLLEACQRPGKLDILSAGQ